MLRFLTIALLITSTLNAQTQQQGWHLKEQASNRGISLDKAYQFLQGRTAKTVIVAVIDSGVDTLHEDLQPVLWRNPKEIPGNGIDDDHNGYTDDIFGWNFLGGKDGRNVGKDSHETDRVYHTYKDHFQSVTDATVLSETEKRAWSLWSRAAWEKQKSLKPAGELVGMKIYFQQLQSCDSILRTTIQKTTYTGEELSSYQPSTEKIKQAKEAFFGFLKRNNALASTNTDILEKFSQWLGSVA